MGEVPLHGEEEVVHPRGGPVSVNLRTSTLAWSASYMEKRAGAWWIIASIAAHTAGRSAAMGAT